MPCHHMLSGRCKLKQQDATTCLLEWPKSKTPTPPNASEDVEQEEPSRTVGGDAKWHSPSGTRLGGFLQKETSSYHVIQQSHFLVFTQSR